MKSYPIIFNSKDYNRRRGNLIHNCGLDYVNGYPDTSNTDIGTTTPPRGPFPQIKFTLYVQKTE